MLKFMVSVVVYVTCGSLLCTHLTRRTNLQFSYLKNLTGLDRNRRC